MYPFSFKISSQLNFIRIYFNKLVFKKKFSLVDLPQNHPTGRAFFSRLFFVSRDDKYSSFARLPQIFCLIRPRFFHNHFQRHIFFRTAGAEIKKLK